MSSILKALKKLEDEKSIRKPDSMKIDADILRGDASRRLSPIGISVLAALLFVCGSSATYFFMKHDKVDMSSPAASPLRSPSPADAIAPVAGKQHDSTLKIESPKPVKIVPAPTDRKHENTPPSSVKSQKLPGKVQHSQSINQSEPKQPAIQPQKSPSLALRPTIPINVPSLKVNGIAFQTESTDRVAIVNGVSVSNGSVIEGAKVEDILKDRVRFSYGGEKFDISMGKSNKK